MLSTGFTPSSPKLYYPTDGYPEAGGSANPEKSISPKLSLAPISNFHLIKINDEGKHRRRVVSEGIYSSVFKLNADSNPQIVKDMQQILLDENEDYVSFQLNENGEALHILKDEETGRLQIAYVSANTLPLGTRFAHHENSSVGTNMEDLNLEKVSNPLKRSLDGISRVNSEAREDHITHGEHENGRRLVKRPETAGQNFYIDGIAEVAARAGKSAFISSHGGRRAPHGHYHEMRIGKHYDLTRKTGGKHLHFAPTTEDGEYRMKETLFVTKGAYNRHAEDLADMIIRSGQLDKVINQTIEQKPLSEINKITLFGHYTDGAAIAILAKEILMQAAKKKLMTRPGFDQSKLQATLNDLQANIVTTWSTHSMGELKRRSYGDQAEYNFRERIAHERDIARHIDITNPTSDSMHELMLEMLDQESQGNKICYITRPGVKDIFFEAGENPLDVEQDFNSISSEHHEILKTLSGKSANPAKFSVERLHNAQLFYHYSRLADSKGVLDTIKMLKKIKEKTDKDPILIMTMSSTEEIFKEHHTRDMEEYRVAKAVEDFLAENNDLRDNVIFQENWTQEECASFYRLRGIWISNAKHEPWGMGTAEALAAGVEYVIASDRMSSAVVISNKAPNVILLEREIADRNLEDYLEIGAQKVLEAMNQGHNDNRRQRGIQAAKPYSWDGVSRRMNAEVAAFRATNSYKAKDLHMFDHNIS